MLKDIEIFYNNDNNANVIALFMNDRITFYQVSYGSAKDRAQGMMNKLAGAARDNEIFLAHMSLLIRHEYLKIVYVVEMQEDYSDSDVIKAVEDYVKK